MARVWHTALVAIAWMVAVACATHAHDAHSAAATSRFHARIDAPSELDWVVSLSNLASASYAPWAHEHWVWWSAKEPANSTNNLSLVSEYLSHGIRVGAVDFDSNWESGWTDFIPSDAYPDMASVVAKFHSLGVRVICWATSMINEDSPNFAAAQQKNYLIRNALNQTGLMKWWHGTGALLDYANGDAVSWWHAQMDGAIALGIDGWKVDGTDPYVMELIEPKTSTGQPITYREYADAYYGDFFDYSRSRIGATALTMSRPVDSVLGTYMPYSPQSVMTSGWVGDNTGDFPGLIDCAKKVLQSAWRGYANFGCDIGGYKQADRTRELMLRWAAFGAFLPMMENGGEDDHRPWSFDVGEKNDTLTTDMYRLFVNAHLALGPYLLTVGTNALETGTSAIWPLAPNGVKENTVTSFQPSTYDYFLGPDIFVSPVLGTNITQQTVAFPTNASKVDTDDSLAAAVSWVNLFDPQHTFSGGVTATINISLDDRYPYPAFQLAASVLPMHVDTDSMPHHGLGSAWQASRDPSDRQMQDVNSRVTPPLTLYIPLHHDALVDLAHSQRVVRSEVRRFQSQSIEVEYTVIAEESASGTHFRLQLSLSPTLDDAHVLIVFGAVAEPIAAADRSQLDAAPTLQPRWSSAALHARMVDRPSHADYKVSRRSSQVDLHRAGNGLVVDDDTGIIMIKPQHTKYGVRCDVRGLVIDNDAALMM